MNHQLSNELRFAAYMRVSEDEQREYGTSLETQRSRIMAAVDQLAGKIVATYGGSEHGTPGYVRDQFDRMITDAEAGKFNAICIADLTRWSRDTVSHEQAVRRLKRSHIRFFVGSTEYDLRNGGMQLALTIATKSSETETNARIDASTYGRIVQAALGFATSGGPPMVARFLLCSLALDAFGNRTRTELRSGVLILRRNTTLSGRPRPTLQASLGVKLPMILAMMRILCGGVLPPLAVLGNNDFGLEI